MIALTSTLIERPPVSGELQVPLRRLVGRVAGVVEQAVDGLGPLGRVGVGKEAPDLVRGGDGSDQVEGDAAEEGGVVGRRSGGGLDRGELGVDLAVDHGPERGVFGGGADQHRSQDQAGAAREAHANLLPSVCLLIPERGRGASEMRICRRIV